MPQTNTAIPPKKHMKSFWPLMIILVIAFIAAGFIYWFQFNLETDYDLQSMVLTVHRRAESKPVTPVNKTTTKATSTK